ncbi:MAG: hypothetical protein J3Q66DRAFT_370818 [Benniella sp.]|nr:MAG: hypothetical protein J3Q66DRAFT_370818 [Benniella sp.]
MMHCRLSRVHLRGISQLPIARVKIIKEDKDVQIVSNEAVFLISIATEIFLEGFTAKAFNLAKLEKRKTVLYRIWYDSLEFLQDALEKQRIAKEKEESGAIEEEDEGEKETNEQGEDSDEEQQHGKL